MINERNLPEVWASGTWEERREEIKEILQREEYGYLPQMDAKVTAEVIKDYPNFCCGHAPMQKLKMTVSWDEEESSFVVYTIIPAEQVKGTFLYLNWNTEDYTHKAPIEEITDRGFAVVEIDFASITADNNDFADGLAGKIYKGRERGESEPGKIAMWAWAAMRVMDYLETLPQIDTSKVAIIGHSRLGKTALFTGLMDERFALTISNDSGCSGACFGRSEVGESIERITNVFPFWFCKNYFKYAGKPETMEFDQHFLIAGIAPRRVYVASASLDEWADPTSEYLSSVAASAVYEKLGLNGLVHPDRLPEVGEAMQEGYIGYHLRHGEHYLSRFDWNHYMDYMEKHIC